MWNTLLTALKGLLFGALAALIGYLKHEEFEKWDFAKCLKTMIIGAITTCIMEVTGLSITDLSLVIAGWMSQHGVSFPAPLIEAVITTSIVIFADFVVKIIVRRTDLVKLWNKLKDFLSGYLENERQKRLGKQKLEKHCH